MVASLSGEQGCSKVLERKKDTIGGERSWFEQVKVPKKKGAEAVESIGG